MLQPEQLPNDALRDNNIINEAVSNLEDGDDEEDEEVEGELDDEDCDWMAIGTEVNSACVCVRICVRVCV